MNMNYIDVGISKSRHKEYKEIGRRIVNEAQRLEMRIVVATEDDIDAALRFATPSVDDGIKFCDWVAELLPDSESFVGMYTIGA